jgi:hypothetical protein
MKNLTVTYPQLPSLLFFSALEAGLLLGCNTGLVHVGTDNTGGTGAAGGGTSAGPDATGGAITSNGGAITSNGGAGSGPCSLLGSWNTISQPWNGLSTASVITFAADGTFTGVPEYAGQYLVDGTSLVIWNDTGVDMDCTFEARWTVSFDSTCNSATLLSQYDNCTGQRRYLDWNVRLERPTVPVTLSQGDSNALSSGGYWWTFTDHNPAGSQYHALIDQATSLTVALQPVTDSDPSHGNVLRVKGSVPLQLPWSDVSTQQQYTLDSHWLPIYLDSKIPAYPEAGIGFGFLKNNAPFDATGKGKWVGIAFDMKVSVPMQTVWVSMPMVGTDLPDPGFADAFSKQCQYYTDSNPPASGYQTCFTHYRKGFRDASSATSNYGVIPAVNTWNRLCVLYSEVGAPNWANAGTVDNLPNFDPTRLLKVRWDMYQPSTGGAAAFDISLDNVSLITEAEARNLSNNCDPTMIGKPPGTGGEG